MPENPSRGIDPRAPRFGAALTTVLTAIALVLALTGSRSPTISGRVLDPGFVVLALVALLFLWGVLAPRTAPAGVLYRRLIAPRLAPPTELEDPAPPRFAQGVGLVITVAGLALHLIGVPLALAVAAALALIAAFLNAVFGLCLGCLMYLGLRRAFGRRPVAGSTTAG
ncbi:DUF4395 domain-containing protein [Microbacterium gorillae]|uniref:DUF4395 domain-containing protein n=1 Tax=Microbacterium gorillae TaxID=1231063 RepID=UPI00058C5249|nr:DUF4395 domain-containing protein [Microbacterium gorillae]